MKGVHNIFWKLLVFSLAMQWMNACPAEPKPGISENIGETKTATPSPVDSSWKLPPFLTDWKLPDSVQIHGFASQSYLFTSGNDFFGHSTNTGSLDFTEMGINGSWRPLPQLQASMQIVYRRAGKTDDSKVRIDFGFLDYSFISDADKVLGVRMGRVVNPIGLYNDTRDMPFTRPSILLPQSIYFDVNRNFALSGDGIQVYGEYRSKLGDFFLHANGFYPRTNDPDLRQGLSPNLSGQPSWLTRLIYEWDAGRIRLGVTSGQFNAGYQPSSGSFRFSPIIISAQYNAENWSLTSEYAIRHVGLKESLQTLANFTGESYYFQGSYRFTNQLEGFLRYDVLYADRNDRGGKEYAAETGLPAYNQFAKDITAGLRWDITSQFMVRAEYHRINGTQWLSALENTGKTQQHWDMFGVSANFRF